MTENGEAGRRQGKAFPTDDLGVPQGSSLSALSANIALRQFDREMNGRGITTVRYLDDFVILGASKKATEKAWASGGKILNSQGFTVHDPGAGTGKAKEGQVDDGLEFLSLHFDRHGCKPTKAACEDLMSALKLAIREAKSNINANLSEARRAESRFAQTLVLLDRKVRGWGDAFACCNQRLTLHQLDGRIDELVLEFEDWWTRRSRGLNSLERRRGLGIALLRDALNAHAPATS